MNFDFSRAGRASQARQSQARQSQMSRVLHMLLLFSVVILGMTKPSQATPLQNKPWIRGDGMELEMRFHGEVVGLDDEAVDPFKIAIVASGFDGSKTFVPKVTGNRFSIWIPVNKYSYRLSLYCESLDGKRLKSLAIRQSGMRNAAEKGLQVVLEPAEPEVTIRTVHNSIPVAGAHVKVAIGAFEILRKSDESGIARFPRVPAIELENITAWTNEGMIGGYQFHRGPTRDSKAPTHEVELFRCRPFKIKFINDSDNSPVGNVAFRFYIATPQPHFNYLGDPSEQELVYQTDDAGEASIPWWPDWPQHHADVALKDNDWFIDDEQENPTSISDDVMTVRIKRRQAVSRKQVTGQLTLPEGIKGGHVVEFFSAHEVRGSGFRDHTFANERGEFSVDVLPDAIYTCYVNDRDWISDNPTKLLFDSKTNQTFSPSLTVDKGTPLTVRVVAGADSAPVANAWVSASSFLTFQTSPRRGHRLAVQRDFFQATDASGKLEVAVPPGPIEVSSEVAGHELKVQGTAEAGKPLELILHAPRLEKIVTKVRLKMPDFIDAELANALVSVRAIQPGRDRFDLTTNPSGEVSFRSGAESLVIFAQTTDGQWAAMQRIDNGPAEVQLDLKQTRPFIGRLLDTAGKPVENNFIFASVRYESHERETAFGELAQFTTQSDQQGQFKFKTLPVGCVINLEARSQQNSNDGQIIDKLYIEPNEELPLLEFEISRPDQPPPLRKTRTYEEHFQSTVRKGRLGNFNIIIIGHIDDEALAKFVETNLIDHETNPDCSLFVQLQLVSRNAKQDLAKQQSFGDFFESKGWPIPEAGQIFVSVLDQQGQELEKAMVRTDDPQAIESLKDLLKRNLPSQHDARVKWEEALAEAARTDRKVWVRLSQRYCRPCFEFADWLDEHRELIEQDFVLLKIDNVCDKNGTEYFKMITEDRFTGVPFTAIYDSQGQKLIDSFGPTGNIGNPGSYVGLKHLRKMLEATRTRLTDQQLNLLIESRGNK